VCQDRSDDTKYMGLFNKVPCPHVGKGGSACESEPPSPVAEDIYMELTVEQAIFCIIAQTVTTPLPSKQFRTNRSIQKQLEIAFGVEVSLRHIQRILKRWKDLDVVGEIEQRQALRVPIHGPKTICYQLKHPEKIIKVKKWKQKKGI